MEPQHTVVIRVVLGIEITLEGNEDTDEVVEGILKDINDGLSPDSRAQINVADHEIYSDEIVRG